MAIDITTLGMKKHSGFTLIELIAVMVIGIILAAVAVPNLNNFVQDSRISAMTNEMITDLYFARAEAIKRNRRVTMCRSNRPRNTNAVCDTANSRTWSTGWIIFVDTQDAGGNPGADGLRQAVEPVVKINDASVSGLDFDPHPDNTTMDEYISYNGRGLARQVNGNVQAGVMRVCDDRGLEDARAITIANTGRAEVGGVVGSCP